MFITKLFPGRRFENLDELTRLTEKRKEMRERLARRKDILKNLKIVSIERVQRVPDGQEKPAEEAAGKEGEEGAGEHGGSSVAKGGIGVSKAKEKEKAP